MNGARALGGADAGVAGAVIDRHGEGVPVGAVLFSTIIEKPFSCARLGRIGMQNWPPPCGS